MPTSRYFAHIPEFPSDVPLADIPTVSYTRLQQRLPDEVDKLYQASREHGFFFIDLNDSPDGKVLLEDAATMFDLTTETLDLGRETLDKYSCKPPKDLEGFKAVGMLRTDEGLRDAIDVYTIGQDDLMGLVPPHSKPDTLEAKLERCQDFCRHAYEACGLVMDALDTKLDFPVGTLRNLSPLDKPSATSFRMLKVVQDALAEGQRIPFGGHTDIGTMTMVFNVLGGLQILPAGKLNVAENWQYIKPQQGCALVNIGDTLVEWTGGLLRSSLHRVHTPPGPQAGIGRISLAYLMRASRDANMERLPIGNVIPARNEGEEDERMPIQEWEAWRARQIIEGKLKPQTRGGIEISTQPGLPQASRLVAMEA